MSQRPNWWLLKSPWTVQLEKRLRAEQASAVFISAAVPCMRRHRIATGNSIDVCAVFGRESGATNEDAVNIYQSETCSRLRDDAARPKMWDPLAFWWSRWRSAVGGVLRLPPEVVAGLSSPAVSRR